METLVTLDSASLTYVSGWDGRKRATSKLTLRGCDFIDSLQSSRRTPSAVKKIGTGTSQRSSFPIFFPLGASPIFLQPLRVPQP
jgi:hypothetical protein